MIIGEKERPSCFRPRSGRAFTIMELLVASAIMTLALIMIYQIWRFITRGGTTEIWAADAASKLTNADTRLREFVNRAGYPTMMTSQGILEPTSASLSYYRFDVSSSGTATEEGTATDQRHVRVFSPQGNEGGPGAGTPIVSFYRVEPGLVGIEGRPNKMIVASKVLLLFQRGHKVAETHAPLADLVMEEGPLDYLKSFDSIGALNGLQAVLNTPRNPGAYRQYTMVSDVSQMKISACTRRPNETNRVELGVSENCDSSSLVRILIDCLEPQLGKRRVSKMIEAETHVGVNMAGTVTR